MKSFQLILHEAINVKDNENFWRWFGKSKVVDENGDPLVVYHSTFGNFSTFKKKRGSHFGFHFGSVGAAHDRMEMTAKDRSTEKFSHEEVNQRVEALIKERDKIRSDTKRRFVEPPDHTDKILAALTDGNDEELHRLLNISDGELTPEEIKRLEDIETEMKYLFDAGTAARSFDYKANASVMPVYLSVQKLLRASDAGNWGSAAKVREATGFDGATLTEIQGNIQHRGYDGIIYKNLVEDSIMGYDSYIVFEPTQIKSAIGNNGNFDPHNPDVNK